jgi:hypothetical protein
MGRADVDAWTVSRDATKYAGPYPVVAHPLCGHWGRYYQKAHDDGRTGPIAVAQIRRFGGVLEHPRDSKLWNHCGMAYPGGFDDSFGGYTLAVNQHDWGHPAYKPTWLYVVGCPSMGLPERPKRRPRPEYEPTPGNTRGILERLSKRQRQLTPPTFAEWLIEVAKRCRPVAPGQ